jgi:hypothetical protein
LAISLAYPSGEERIILLVEVISTCLRGTYRERGWGISTLWLQLLSRKTREGQRHNPFDILVERESLGS